MSGQQAIIKYFAKMFHFINKELELMRQRYLDRFADTVAIFISIVSSSYYRILWVQIHITLPP